jgi:hypothetical protein
VTLERKRLLGEAYCYCHSGRMLMLQETGTGLEKVSNGSSPGRSVNYLPLLTSEILVLVSRLAAHLSSPVWAFGGVRASKAAA